MERADSALRVYLTVSERKAVREAAHRLNSSQSYVMRRFVHLYLSEIYEEILKSSNDDHV